MTKTTQIIPIIKLQYSFSSWCPQDRNKPLTEQQHRKVNEEIRVKWNVEDCDCGVFIL